MNKGPESQYIIQNMPNDFLRHLSSFLSTEEMFDLCSGCRKLFLNYYTFVNPIRDMIDALKPESKSDFIQNPTQGFIEIKAHANSTLGNLLINQKESEKSLQKLFTFNRLR